MHYPEDDEPEFETEMDVPMTQPIASVPLTLSIPVPSIEQVAGEMARQIIAAHAYYQSKAALERQAETAMAEAINSAIERRVLPMIEALLDKPMQPTDNFGNPIGAPVSLQGFLAQRVESWANDIVDSDGKPGRPDAYNRDRYQSRLSHLVANVANREMKNAVDAETARVIREIKERGTKNIAEMVAGRISDLIIKKP